MTSTITAEALRGMNLCALARVMRGGHPIDPAALDDREYRGVSLGLPKLVDRVLWKTFKKTFHRDPETQQLRGWNIRIEQGARTWDFVPMTRRGAPMTFGHYIVHEARGRRMPARWDQGLFLDYGEARNPCLDPARSMRAPIVAVNPGDPTLLLGWDYLQLGPLQLPTPAFWSLERDSELAQVIPLPGR